MSRKSKNLLEGIVVSKETRNKIERKARREAEMEVGVDVSRNKVHKSMKNYSRKTKHRNQEF
jgi:hypothetical protein